ncbi:Uncharacterised protein [Bacillus tequilensis]|nr:Uncharacterised protein [Bacillus tequilensis]
MYGKEHTVRKCMVSFLIVCAAAVIIFEPKILHSQNVLRGFNVVIGFSLYAVFLERTNVYHLFLILNCHQFYDSLI